MRSKGTVIDLHCHTNRSDNSLSVSQVLQLAKINGVTHLAITDHNTTLGVNEGIRLGRQMGIEVIPGVEISAYDYKRKVKVHILGYYIEPEHPYLEKVCTFLIESRKKSSQEMMKRIQDTGYHITWEQVEKYTPNGTGVFKQHIMHALKDQGYCDQLFGGLYSTLFSPGEDGKEQGLAYVSMDYVDAVEAIQAIRAAGGVPVVAHPGQYNNYEAIEEWAEAGLEGIELFSPAHHIRDEWKVRSMANQYHLITTGGSDFHGLYGDPRAYPGRRRDLGYKTIEHLKEKSHSIGSKQKRVF